ESAGEQGAMLASSRVAAQTQPIQDQHASRCATMERCVPKDCTNHRATLPKRLGKKSTVFIVCHRLLKNMKFHDL
ncbi:MAG: hypothetical protein ABWY17_19975, partial [Pseudomonas sp.]